MHSLENDLTMVRSLVREAGDIVRVYHDRQDEIDWKGTDAGGRRTDPVTAADHAVNAFLVEHLRAAFPEDGILAEESKDNEERLGKRRVWCIDPLDGTKEFIARNGEFSIMVGLAVDGVAALGVVYQPVQDFMYSGLREVGAWMDETPLHVSPIETPAEMRLVVSRSHRNPITDAIKATLGVTQERISGSVGLKCGLIARGEADLYLHPAPGTKEWDTCAPEAILTGAGGKMTDCWGRPLVYNQRDVARHGGIVASNGRAHHRIISLMIPRLAEAGIEAEVGW
ncbi:MAG: 3'(2'),5'-bisphosphate nucleotidase CysQ [Caldilineales bacterium]|nr:3'(2'),5'-bisphosphate nucleotidase CysQ [Caldilineales bacterium]